MQSEKIKTKKRVLAICGSTRVSSVNLGLITAIGQLGAEMFDVIVFHGLSELPHFNPDLDTEDPPLKIARFREKIKSCDGILICTPEYAMGVPGTLKNAIDWTVSSMEFSHKPTALITASSVGEKAHASLLETLKIIEAQTTEETTLLISYAKTKITHEGFISDPTTLQHIKALVQALADLLNH